MILLCNRVIASQCYNQRSIHKEYAVNMSYFPSSFPIHAVHISWLEKSILVTGYGHFHFKVHLQLQVSTTCVSSWPTACHDDMVHIERCHFYTNRYLTGCTIRKKMQLSGWEWNISFLVQSLDILPMANDGLSWLIFKIVSWVDFLGSPPLGVVWQDLCCTPCPNSDHFNTSALRGVILPFGSEVRTGRSLNLRNPLEIS